MSIISKIIETAVQFAPDKKPDKLIQQSKYVGQPISRVDGQLKVTGEAKFSAEYHFGQHLLCCPWIQQYCQREN